MALLLDLAELLVMALLLDLAELLDLALLLDTLVSLSLDCGETPEEDSSSSSWGFWMKLLSSSPQATRPKAKARANAKPNFLSMGTSFLKGAIVNI